MQNANSIFRLDDKVALVVGAASGIGRAAAIAFADSGASVVCADVSHEGAQKVANEIGGSAKALAMDIRSAESVRAAIAEIQHKFKTIDVLLTTPAVNVRKRLLSYTDEELDRVVDLNLKGTFRI